MLKKIKRPSKKIIILVALVFLIPLGFIFLKNILFNSKKPEDRETVTSVNTNNTSAINLPESFPEDFPIYQNSVLVASESKKDKIEGMSAIWETTSSIDEVTSFYLTNFVTNGWKYEIVSQEKDITSITFNKERVAGFMAVSKGKDNKVVITVALGVK